MQPNTNTRQRHKGKIYVKNTRVLEKFMQDPKQDPDPDTDRNQLKRRIRIRVRKKITACQDLTDISPEGLAFSDERSVLLETAVQLVQMSIIIRPAATAEKVTSFKTIMVYEQLLNVSVQLAFS